MDTPCVEPIDVPEDSPGVANARSSPLNEAELKERRQRKKLRLKKLEKKLEVLDRQIKKCAEAEVSLDEMDGGYSAYIKEDILKRKFVKTWQELCQLQRVSDCIVIEDRDSSGYEGTPYPEVNRRVQRLLRLDEFPDYIDIVQLLDRCNTKHSLGIAAEEKGQLARKVFKEVGKIMKRNRHRDFLHHFGSHLTDSFAVTQDPAEQDEDLLMELQKSMREGEKKMQTIVEEFVIKQEQEYGSQRSPEGDSCSAAEHGEEGQEQDEEEEERDEEELINVVDDESESGMDSGDHMLPRLSNITEDSSEGISGEGGEGGSCLRQSAANLLEVAPDSTTIHSESSEAVVTSTHRKQVNSSEAQDQPGPSGLLCTPVTHISSSSEVVCLDDESEDLIVISDSDPG